MRGLLGDRVTDVVARRQTVTISDFRTPEEWRDFWKTAYGPTIVAYRTIGDDPRAGRRARPRPPGTRRPVRPRHGTTVLDWEYLLLTARRA